MESFFKYKTFKSLKEVMKSFFNSKNFKSRKEVMVSFFSIKNFRSCKAVIEFFLSFKSFKSPVESDRGLFQWSRLIKFLYDVQISWNNIWLHWNNI